MQAGTLLLEEDRCANGQANDQRERCQNGRKNQECSGSG